MKTTRLYSPYNPYISLSYLNFHNPVIHKRSYVMTPYYLLSRDRTAFDQMLSEAAHHPRTHNRLPASSPETSLSQMISSGTFHGVSAIERGWMRLGSVLRG